MTVTQHPAAGHSYESHPQGEDYCWREGGDDERCGLPLSDHPISEEES